MSRIDVETLVRAFEHRIAELEKNPPDKVPTDVVLKLLENAIEDELKKHFIHLIQRDLRAKVNKEFKKLRKEWVSHAIEKLFSDNLLKAQAHQVLCDRIMHAVKGEL